MISGFKRLDKRQPMVQVKLQVSGKLLPKCQLEKVRPGYSSRDIAWGKLEIKMILIKGSSWNLLLCESCE